MQIDRTHHQYLRQNQADAISSIRMSLLLLIGILPIQEVRARLSLIIQYNHRSVTVAKARNSLQ